MLRKDMVEMLIFNELETAHAMSLEDYDAYVTDLLFEIYGKKSDAEIKQMYFDKKEELNHA